MNYVQLIGVFLMVSYAPKVISCVCHKIGCPSIVMHTFALGVVMLATKWIL